MPSRSARLVFALTVAFGLANASLAVAQTTPTATTTATPSTKHVKKSKNASPTTTAGTMAPTSGSKFPATSQFSTVAAAQAHCPGDTVVWSTMSKSKSYHLSTSKYFGKTKHGAYACEKEVTAAGFHAAKS